MYPSSGLRLSYETDDAVYFMSNAFDPLNPWSGHLVRLWGKRFLTAEHAYHFRKFCETLPQAATAIRHAPSAWAAMQIERRHKHLVRSDWDKVKYGIMLEILRAKVAQHEDVRACLLATGHKTIYKNSPFDEYWGVGKHGHGQNKIGRIYMQIREELQQETA
jgi:N-glycosidase YbiA